MSIRRGDTVTLVALPVDNDYLMTRMNDRGIEVGHSYRVTYSSERWHELRVDIPGKSMYFTIPYKYFEKVTKVRGSGWKTPRVKDIST